MKILLFCEISLAIMTLLFIAVQEWTPMMVALFGQFYFINQIRKE